MTQTAYGKMKIPVPKELEQSAIVNYLDKVIYRIEKSIQSKQTQLTELESYKKSLIYEYVTGKKRV